MENRAHNDPSRRKLSDAYLTASVDLLEAPSQYLPAPALDERALEAASAAVADPVRATIRLLVDQLFDEVVQPTLAAETQDELFLALRDRLAKYNTTMSALVVLFSTTPAGVALVNRAEKSGATLAQDAAKIGGQSAAEEADFADSTYRSAHRIVARFGGFAVPRDLGEDRKFAAQFNRASSLFTLGACMLGAISRGRCRSTPVGVKVAFEMIRKGALDAYAAARAAIALRQPPEPACDDHYASGEDVRIGDTVMVDTDTGKCAIIERIDASGLSGRYSGSDDAWTARDVGGVRLMRRANCADCGESRCVCGERVWGCWSHAHGRWVLQDDVPATKSKPEWVRWIGSSTDRFEVRRYIIGDLIRATPEERVAWVAVVEVGGVPNTTIDLPAPSNRAIEFVNVNPDPYAHTAEREKEIYARQILQDAFGSDYTVGVYRLLDGAVKNERLPAKLRAAIACVRWGGPSAERTAAEILNPKAKR